MAEKILLLLSGGRDSALALKLLLQENFIVIGLCVTGIQKKEIVGAKLSAEANNIQLIESKILFFDEETWNPIKLVARDLAMGIVAIYHCKKHDCPYLATGVKKSDLENPKLFWLNSFLKFACAALRLFNINLIFPLNDKFEKS